MQIPSHGPDLLSAFERPRGAGAGSLARGRILGRASDVQERSRGLDVGGERSVESPGGFMATAIGVEGASVRVEGHARRKLWR